MRQSVADDVQYKITQIYGVFGPQTVGKTKPKVVVLADFTSEKGQ
jgi:hypothetical protein